mgnify:CR=1 FL=1
MHKYFDECGECDGRGGAKEQVSLDPSRPLEWRECDKCCGTGQIEIMEDENEPCN